MDKGLSFQLGIYHVWGSLTWILGMGQPYFLDFSILKTKWSGAPSTRCAFSTLLCLCGRCPFCLKY